VLDVLTPAVPLALAGTSFALGARHGLDWDHIAAITDLTAPRTDDEDTRRTGRRGLGLSAWYCLGHGLVLAVLGALVLALGVGLPSGMDVAFEHLVGLTLVLLGGVVLYQLGRYRSDYQYTGRISLVVGALRRGWARARRREVPGGALDVDRRGAFLVGCCTAPAPRPRRRSRCSPRRRVRLGGTAASVLGAFVAGLVLTDLGDRRRLAVRRARQPRAPRVQLALGRRHRRRASCLGPADPHGHAESSRR
jgi:high-affinity nickel-transport protein